VFRFLRTKRQLLLSTLQKWHIDSPGLCKEKHSDIRCSELVPRRGGAPPQPCNWYASEELLLDFHVNDRFILHARLESTRDLLMLPNPNFQEKGWKTHYDNRTLCQMPTFWSFAHQYCRELSPGALPTDPVTLINKVAFNFGVWESVMSSDHRALDCHGHAHLDLTKDAVNYLGQIYPMLDRRRNPPENHLGRDIDSLETHRVLFQRMDRMESKLDTLTSSFKDLEGSFKVLEGSFKVLEVSNTRILGLLETFVKQKE